MRVIKIETEAKQDRKNKRKEEQKQDSRESKSIER